MVCLFAFGFAWSWGPLGWLIPSEIQPLETRCVGQSFATAVNFLIAFIVGQSFLATLCAMRWGALRSYSMRLPPSSLRHSAWLRPRECQ
ncbi:hypothetical protein WJX75_008205 [Coccomyxa subellipsoidea]|uniref:Major facilitator superfamily (MFS) profile domain-containing protein n=1 Tax=Coccomyxa subellipsoidea TaxID=248742 RepID=A0ABR2Z296_9CHLO